MWCRLLWWCALDRTLTCLTCTLRDRLCVVVELFLSLKITSSRLACLRIKLTVNVFINNKGSDFFLIRVHSHSLHRKINCIITIICVWIASARACARARPCVRVMDVRVISFSKCTFPFVIIISIIFVLFLANKYDINCNCNNFCIYM